ncbi:MAG TPA: hypothetical protein PKD49_15355 [Hyphomicrobium sp.]|nr:hypothetical protein [Hyphomicrobium sp.]
MRSVHARAPRLGCPRFSLGSARTSAKRRQPAALQHSRKRCCVRSRATLATNILEGRLTINIFNAPLDNTTSAAIVARLQGIPRFEDSYADFIAIEGNESDTRWEFCCAILEPLTGYGLPPGIQHWSTDQFASLIMQLLLGHSINSNNSREI